jgi:hypothetical protein
MALVVDGGGLVNKGGALGTGQACCCGGGCDCSAAGFAPAVASDAERGLVYLEFSACIGSGAEGTVDAPQAASPCDYEGMSGAITGATLTDGGSGYAVLGRVEPTVTASVTGGSGATLSVTLTEGADFLGDTYCLEVPYWRVDGVSVTSGGSGYSDKQAVTFSAAAGDTVVEHAKAYAYVAIEEPQSPSFNIYDQDGNPSAGVGAVLVPAFAVVSGTSISRGGAANPPFCNVPNRTAYEVTGVTITNGGSGYAVDDFVEISFANSSDGSVSEQLNATVTAVTGGGAITAITLTYGGAYGGGFTDTLDSVVVEGCISGGAGKYYREDPSEPPYVAEVTVTIQQQAPSTGNGAVVTATVEDDTASAVFGEIVSLMLVDGGSGYLSPPEACPLPEKLYFSWGDYNAEIPVFVAQGDEPASGFVCPGPSASCRDRLWYRVDPDGDGVFCDWALQERNTDDTGNVGSRSYAVIEQGLVCRCGGKLHLTVRFVWQCLECVHYYKGTATNQDCFGGLVGLSGGHGLLWRINFVRASTLCLAFEMDELGCPVGDAIFVSQEILERASPGTSLNPGIHEVPCAQYEDPETGHVYGGDPCPCDTGCVETPPGTPTVSMMPP